MNKNRSNENKKLNAGDWVEVLGREEILATLDEKGELENVPFMPEMVQFCGQKFRIFKRADKTCDPAHEPWSIRRVRNCVHLEAVRCNGDGHDGCQAGCLIFWNEGWLKRGDNTMVFARDLRGPRPASGRCAVENIWGASQKKDADGEIVYSCQATELRNFTSAMSPLDPRQYVRDLLSGNLSGGLARDSRSGRALEMILSLMRLVYALAVSAASHYIAYPFIAGTQEKTPVENLNLLPGELVQVRSKEEIMATLDKYHRNRGLLFDGEMIPYCGGIYRVLRRVNHIIDEKTGKMVNMKRACIVLEGVVCRSDFHRLCPRAIYPYRRENWLTRVVNQPAQPSEQPLAETCEK